MMRTKVAVAALLCVPLLAGCGNAVASSHVRPAKFTIPDLKIDQNVGFVQGRLISIGGPQGAPNSPDQGAVTLTNATTGAAWTIPTAANGTFNAYITPGIYNATGTTPQYVVNGGERGCSANGPVTVRLNKTVTIAVTCVRR